MTAECDCDNKLTSSSSSTTITTTDPQQLWYLQGHAYDLRDFVQRHPGGPEALWLGQGRADCTALVLSYHPFSLEAVQRTLAKYRVHVEEEEEEDAMEKKNSTTTAVVGGTRPLTPTTCTTTTAQQTCDTTTTTTTTPNHSIPTRDAFYQVLCVRVAQELQSQGLDPRHHRAAHVGRVFYYAVIAVLVVVSGGAHAVKVSL